MSNSFSQIVKYTRLGTGYYNDLDQEIEGRWHFHHTSDTVTWQTRKVGETLWHDRLVVSNEEYDALKAALEEIP